jgi:hypothetical protein
MLFTSPAFPPGATRRDIILCRHEIVRGLGDEERRFIAISRIGRRFGTSIATCRKRSSRVGFGCHRARSRAGTSGG